MAGLLSLTPGAPGIGLTRQNKYASLHGDSLRQPDKTRKPSPPILASPIGSSSDEEPDGLQVPEDRVSDDLQFGGGETRREKSSIHSTLNTGGNSHSSNDEDGEKGGLSVEPSSIRASTFKSGTGPNSRNGSQTSQKRKDTDVDDEDVPLSFSQSKKLRQSYGYGSMSMLRGYVTKSSNHTKKPPTNRDKGGPHYRDFNPDSMLARVDRLGAKAEESKTARFKEIPAMQASQRDQRASQRSVKSTQESSQSSSKSFKQPKRLSPKKVPKFRASPVVCEDPPRATRSSALVEVMPAPRQYKALKSFKFQNALKTATEKLGVSNTQLIASPPATHGSSAPSITLDAASTVSSPLSSLEDSTLDSSQEGAPIITSGDIAIYSAPSRPAVCPMCKQPVDESFWEEFSKVDTRMSLRQQGEFCKAHKERSAESEWTERGYPEIDWQQLDTRITKHHPVMDDILSRRRFSFYRNAFEDILKRGKNKTLQETLMEGDDIESMSPGYYGGRGAKVMADNIMSRFASKLRRLAASDKLIFSGGVSRYVQAVLVPELAVLLIKDDMKVDDEKAREIMRDSVDIGNLLNEEEDEIITEPAPAGVEVVEIM